MHLALQHDGQPALLRVEGPAGAPVALFFHPFPLHSDVWDEMLSACAASGLCAAALDAPGFGGTPPLGAPLTMDALAELGACALDTLGARRAAVVGGSMGGYAAMAFARRFPGRLKAVARIAASVPGARLHVIAGAGHLPFLEKPREVAPLLTAHLQVRVRE